MMIGPVTPPPIFSTGSPENYHHYVLMGFAWMLDFQSVDRSRSSGEPDEKIGGHPIFLGSFKRVRRQFLFPAFWRKIVAMCEHHLKAVNNGLLN